MKLQCLKWKIHWIRVPTDYMLQKKREENTSDPWRYGKRNYSKRNTQKNNLKINITHFFFLSIKAQWLLVYLQSCILEKTEWYSVVNSLACESYFDRKFF